MRFIPIGRILSPHGLRGEVKVKYFNEASEDFFSYASFFTAIDGNYVELKPVRAQLRNGLFYLIFEGIDDVDKVRPLVNKELAVRESDLPALPEGTYYDYQLVGLDVIGPSGTAMGRVGGVHHTRGGDILSVVREGVETLVPLSDDRVEEIDLPAHVLRLTGTPDTP